MAILIQKLPGVLRFKTPRFAARSIPPKRIPKKHQNHGDHEIIFRQKLLAKFRFLEFGSEMVPSTWWE